MQRIWGPANLLHHTHQRIQFPQQIGTRNRNSLSSSGTQSVRNNEALLDYFGVPSGPVGELQRVGIGFVPEGSEIEVGPMVPDAAAEDVVESEEAFDGDKCAVGALESAEEDGVDGRGLVVASEG